MTPLALTFMVGSWAFVLGLTAWSFHRVLRGRASRPPGDPPGRDRDS